MTKLTPHQIKILISEIQSRPALWRTVDMNKETCKNLGKLWDAVTLKVGSERSTVRNKWRNLKGKFEQVRHEPRKAANFEFYDDLCFLNECLDVDDLVVNDSDTEGEKYESERTGSPTSKRSAVETKASAKSPSSNVIMENVDMMFYQTIKPIIQKMPLSKRMKFQRAVNAAVCKFAYGPEVFTKERKHQEEESSGSEDSSVLSSEKSDSAL